MKGTEKQVAWAMDIINLVSEIMKDMEEANKNHPQIEMVKKMHSTVLNNMKNANASDIIDDFAGIEKKIGDVNGNYTALVSRMKTAEFTYKRNYRA